MLAEIQQYEPPPSNDNIDLGTVERWKKGDMEFIGDGSRLRARAKNPLKIDTLLRRKHITPMQHIYAKQILTYHMVMTRHHLKAVNLSDNSAGATISDASMTRKITCADYYLYTMRLLHEKSIVKGLYCDLVHYICIMEEDVLKVARRLLIPRKDAMDQMGRALDCLGDALADMRDHYKRLEEQQEIAANPKYPVTQ